MRRTSRAAGMSLMVATLFAIAGCGGAPVPEAARSDAHAAARSAREVGAERQPQASYYLELADEAIGQAEECITRGDMARAERLLRRAEADAELALAITRTAEEGQNANESMQRIEEMRERHL